MSSLTSSGEEAITYELVKDGGEHCIPYSDNELSEVYCIDRCISWIQRMKLSRVSLQFPQEFSCDAPLVFLKMKQESPSTDLSITFNSAAAKCCINQKDADYSHAEGVIQFGRSCLTAVPRVCVLRVLAPHWAVDVEAVVQGACGVPEVAEVIAQGASAADFGAGNPELPPRDVVVLYDTRCAHAMADVEQRLRNQLPNVQMSRLLIPEDPLEEGHEDFTNECSTCVCSYNYCLGVCGFCLANRGTWKFEVPKDCTKSHSAQDDSGVGEVYNETDVLESEITNNGNQTTNTDEILGSYSEVVFLLNGRLVRIPKSKNCSDLLFIYIGRPGPTLTSMSLKWPQCNFYVVNPCTGAVSTVNAAKIVMQRNIKIEKIKDANKIGLLVSNFNLPRFDAILHRLTFLIKSAGKKPFLQYAAHPDLAKLMNVPNIDVFVYIACPESTVIEREVDPDLYRLMATPWELEVALHPDRERGFKFETDPLELLEGGHSFVPLPTTQFQAQTVSVSLVSNRTQSVGVVYEECDNSSPPLTSSTGALVQTSDMDRQVARVLEGRSRGLMWGDVPWYGLDPKVEEPVALGEVMQGKAGVAGGYSSEKNILPES